MTAQSKHRGELLVHCLWVLARQIVYAFHTNRRVPHPEWLTKIPQNWKFKFGMLGTTPVGSPCEIGNTAFDLLLQQFWFKTMRGFHFLPLLAEKHSLVEEPLVPGLEKHGHHAMILSWSYHNLGETWSWSWHDDGTSAMFLTKAAIFHNIVAMTYHDS